MDNLDLTVWNSLQANLWDCLEYQNVVEHNNIHQWRIFSDWFRTFLKENMRPPRVYEAKAYMEEKLNEQ